jgi:hypothetical protein
VSSSNRLMGILLGNGRLQPGSWKRTNLPASVYAGYPLGARQIMYRSWRRPFSLGWGLRPMLTAGAHLHGRFA